MEKIYQGKYLSISHDQANQLFHYVFGANTQYMSSEEYISELQVFIDLVKKHEPKRVLGDMVDFNFTITPQVQEWINEKLFPVYQQVGFKKIAILLSKGFFQSLSIQQTMQEENATSFQTAYFDNAEKASEWLQN
jgi:hypothetical protein